MEAAAAELPVLGSGSGPDIAVHVLTGRRFWYQTAFCLWSLSRQSGRIIAPVFYNDGTLDEPTRAPLLRLFPLARVVEKHASVANLDSFLPAARYPALRERWSHYPHIRKLIDPHVGQTGWKLVLDSDLLFFRRPDFLLSWLDGPAKPLHAVDCISSYGYPRQLMDKLAGRAVADLVNVGLTGLNGQLLDWDRIEHWCSLLLEKEGTSYYLEQALTAMVLAGHDCAVAPGADYVTLPCPPEADECRAVMHHYVAQSKRWYFRYNWKKAMGAP
jgi:hypothetical protein